MKKRKIYIAGEHNLLAGQKCKTWKVGKERNTAAGSNKI
jgi:hypothetical protein